MMSSNINYEYPLPGKCVLIDIHQYTGIIKDWEKLKQNAAGVLIKLTDGKFPARYGIENWKAAKEHGVPRGGWGWLYNSRNVSVNGQARYAWSVLRDDPGELPFFIDYEWTKYNGLPSNPELKDLTSWLDVFELESGMIPGIYTAPGYWAQYGSTDPRFARYPLWLANYDPQPFIPKPWEEWKIWQWTEAGFGEDYGVDKYQERAVDLNYYNGTLNEFHQWIGWDGGANPDPQEPPTGDKMPKYTATIKYDNMRIRTGHSTYDPNISTFGVGDRALGDEIWVAPADGDQVKAGDKWLRVSTVVKVSGAETRFGTAAWIAIIHLGKEYCTLHEDGGPVVPPPAPPPVDTVEFLLDSISINVNGTEFRANGILLKKV